MSNVEVLPVRANMEWVCECGCSSFSLKGDGRAVCASCDSAISSPEVTGGWHRIESTAVWDGHEPFQAATSSGRIPEFARRHVMRRAEGDDVVFIGVVKADGTTSAWFHDDAGSSRPWFWRRMQDIMHLYGTAF